MLTVLAAKSYCEVIILASFPINPYIFFPALGVFWIFLIWVLWKIVQSMKCTAASLKQIAESLKNKS